MRAMILTILLLAASHVLAAGAELPGPHALASRLLEAERERAPYPELAREFPTLTEQDLSAVQRAYLKAKFAAGFTPGGFKGGFIPAAPLGGVLYAEGLLSAPADIPRQSYVAPLVEAEIAFEFCAPVTTPLADVAALRAVVCRLRPAIELPDGALEDLAGLKQDLARLRRALIPHNVATRKVLLGNPVPAAAVDVNTVPVETWHAGTSLGRRDLGAGKPDLWVSVLWVVNEYALAEGYALRPGQIIIPGNLTGLHAGEAGPWVVDYGPLGRIEFTLE